MTVDAGTMMLDREFSGKPDQEGYEIPCGLDDELTSSSSAVRYHSDSSPFDLDQRKILRKQLLEQIESILSVPRRKTIRCR